MREAANYVFRIQFLNFWRIAVVVWPSNSKTLPILRVWGEYPVQNSRARAHGQCTQCLCADLLEKSLGVPRLVRIFDLRASFKNKE